jgi:hypothetical protein
MSKDEHRFGGHERKAVNYARLLSELEGSYTLLKYLGFKEDMEVLEEMKKRYYYLYFKAVKEERDQGA